MMLMIADPSRKNLIFGSIAAAVLGVLLAVMLIVACRNRDRMKEVVKNFLKLELRTAAELLLDVWDIYGAPVPSLWVPPRFDYWTVCFVPLIGSPPTLGARLQVAASTAGDSFTFSTMLGMRHIDWVQGLLVPWIVFFALAAVASAFSILSKLHFFVGKMLSNFARRSHRSASTVTVHDALAQNDFNTRKIYAYANTCTEALASVRRHASTKPHCTFQQVRGRRALRGASLDRRPVASAALPVTLLPMQSHSHRRACREHRSP